MNAVADAIITDSSAPPDTLRCDSLSVSVMSLIALSCLQPLVAFARGVLFCGLLDPIQMGCWDMALSFMSLATPLVLLGVPGSYGRYVEHYAQRGQLAMFLRRTTVFCGVLLVLSVLVVASGGRLFSVLIFNSPDYTRLVLPVAIGLGTTIAFGYVGELLTALRMFRIVSVLQMIKGAGFAVFGAVLLWGWDRGPAAIIAGNSLSTLLAAVVGLFWIWPAWRSLPQGAPRGASGHITHGQLWARLAPFALWVWVANILAQVYEIVDRLMIVHCSKLSPEAALSAVGQYHASRIVPMLFVSFAAMLGSLILPHLTRDWEAGRKKRVRAHLNLAIKLLGLALMLGSVLVLCTAPALFRFGFRGKYDGGLEVLPWTLAYCAWFGLSFIAGTYLWVAERVRLGSASLLAGLIVNVVLNLILLPPLGLMGAVLATAASKLVVLAMVVWFGRNLGMRFELGSWLVMALPLALPLGAAASVAALVMTGVAILATDRVLLAEEKQLLLETAEHYAARSGALAAGFFGRRR